MNEAVKKDDLQENLTAAREISTMKTPVIVPADLPDSVKNQLIGYAEIELKNQLVECISALNRFVNVDEIVVTMYDRHKRVDLQRNKLIKTLNVLVREGRIGKSNSPRGYLPAVLKGEQS